MNTRMPYATSIACFLAGGVAGAAAALLLAPQSGRATRERISRKVADAADSARDMKNRAVQKGGEVLEEATQRISGAASALAGGDGHALGVKVEHPSA
jgi:gas vesicle protein